MYTLYMFSVQIVFCASLLASVPSSGQKAKSVKDIKVSLDLENKRIIDALDKIERKTGFTFVYLKNQIDRKLRLDGNYHATSLYDVLSSVSRQTGLRFQRVNNNINVKKQTGQGEVAIVEIIQEKIVTGKVTDVDGNELPGVAIIIKGTVNGTVTDAQGNYQINVPGNDAVLQFSYLGYSTEEIIVGTQSVIDIRMVLDLTTLQEVVVTGYTSQSRRSITGAVETVDVEELAKNPAASIEQKLQGQVSGVNILTSGSPGSGAQVRIRGFGTTSSNSPLYIIDGIPTGAGLNEINPDDIESVSVVKDASAASIYGARAANGVVVITTKKGERGKEAQISYNSFFSIDTQPGKIDLLNAQQWGEMEWLGQRAAGIANPSHPTYGNGENSAIPVLLSGNPTRPYDPETNRIMFPSDTDWFDELTQTGFTQSHNLSVAGGGEGSAYNVSFGYFNSKGTQIYSDYQRYTTRLNTEFTALNDKVRIGENLSIAYSERLGSTSSDIGRFTYHPLIPVYDEGGNFGGTLGGTLGLGTNIRNPVAEKIRFQNNVTRRIRAFGGAYAEVDVLPGLTFKTNVGIDYTQDNRTSFSPEFPEGGNPGNALTETSSWGSSLTWTNTLNYVADFGDHTLGILAGTEIIELKNRGISISGTDFFLEDPAFTFIDAAGNISRTEGNGFQRNLSSLFGKIDYGFKDKYLVNYTIRRDGSSALPSGNRFDVFQAVGAAWILSDEAFLEGNGFFNLLKIRAGWGQAGNQNSLGAFDFASTFVIDPLTTGYDINATNSGFVSGIALANRGNDNLTWETSETLNAGLDFAFLDNKISGSVEWYNRKTLGLLQRDRLPLTSGSAAAPFINIGEIENKGIDLTLGYDGMVGPVTLGVTAIVSGYRNEVIDLDGNPETFLGSSTSRTQAGHPIASFYGLIQDGVIQDGADAGNFNFRDISEDGTIDLTDDGAYIGNPHPDFTYSLNLNAGYKNFDFTLFFRGSQGNDIWQSFREQTDFQFRSLNRTTRVLNAWRPDNPTNELAEYNVNTAPQNARSSSYFIEDGSYLRLQTLQLGYTFPGINGLQNLRVYVQAQNLLTITNYSGIDPEIPDISVRRMGVDRGDIYAVPRSFIFGLNVRF